MALRYRELHDEDWLRQRYELEGRSTYTIAAELGCDDATVSRALRRFGIKGRLGRPAAVKPGEVYGLLTVIAELAERDRGGRAFLCRCDCGNTHAVRAVELRAGKTRSCGCLRRDCRPVPPPAVHPGERYGRLVVLREAERPASGGARAYVCVCVCGQQTTVRGSNLKRGPYPLMRVSSAGLPPTRRSPEHRPSGSERQPTVGYGRADR